MPQTEQPSSDGHSTPVLGRDLREGMAVRIHGQSARIQSVSYMKDWGEHGQVVVVTTHGDRKYQANEWVKVDDLFHGHGYRGG